MIDILYILYNLPSNKRHITSDTTCAVGDTSDVRDATRCGPQAHADSSLDRGGIFPFQIPEFQIPHSRFLLVRTFSISKSFLEFIFQIDSVYDSRSQISDSPFHTS